MRSRDTYLSVLLGCSLLLGACNSPDTQAATIPSAPSTPQEIVVRAFDYQYDMPDTILSGPTTFRLINDGPEFHHLYLVRLEGGHTLGDLMQHLAASQGAMPSWAIDVGGPNTPGLPGEETNATLNLEPGEYAVLCVIHSPDHIPHLMKGMVRPLTVLPGPAASAPLVEMPAASVVMVLDDYSFETDRPITPGKHTIRFVNVAAQSHEAIFVRLAPGNTVEEFHHFLHQPVGPPPGKLIGGITNLAPGEENLVEMEFAPGEYGLLCFTPDAKDRMAHVVHGMIKQFSVR
jgi:plastocyanin